MLKELEGAMWMFDEAMPPECIDGTVGVKPFKPIDVVHLERADVPLDTYDCGEGDTERAYVGQLRDGRWFYLVVGHDYTFEWGRSYVSSTLEGVLKNATVDELKKLGY